MLLVLFSDPHRLCLCRESAQRRPHAARMPEPQQRATWDARIREVEATHPQAAGWIAEALELGEQAVRDRKDSEAANVQRLAEQREKIRTSEELLENLARRVLAATTALDAEKARRQEADRRVAAMQASLSGASEAAKISAEAAAAGRQALTVAMRRAEQAEQEKLVAQEEVRKAMAGAAEAADRAQNLAAHVQAVERRHAELLGHDPALHSDIRSSTVSPRRRTAPEPNPEPELLPAGVVLPLSPIQGRRAADSWSQSPPRSSRRSPRRSIPGVRSPTASSINQRGRRPQQHKPVDGVPRFNSQSTDADTPGVGSYDVYTRDTIAARAAAAKDTGKHRKQLSPHRPVRPSREISLCADTAGAKVPLTLAHSEGLQGSQPVRKTQRCTFNG